MRLQAAVAALVMVAVSGCIGGQPTEEATLLIDFNGQNPIGIHDIFVEVDFDPTSRPSASAYDGRDVAHPDNYTVHDMLVEWEGASSLVFAYHAGVGYKVDEILGVATEAVHACWTWEVFINDAPRPSVDAVVQDGDEVVVRYTDCTPPPIPMWSATLQFDFNGTAPFGLEQNLSEELTFDPESRPAAGAYNASTIAHPDGFTVHDLMAISEHDGNFVMSYFDPFGFSLDEVYGVANDFNGTCLFWHLSVNDVSAEVGLSLVQVQEGDVVRWTYTPC